jgi:GNAT superfamily N-acetyltransferase
MNNIIDVRLADISDMKFIDHLQRKNAEELSFYPSCVFEREIPIGRVLLASVNGEPAGYVYHGACSARVKIHQACIEYDLRGQLYGAALVRFFESVVRPFGCLSVTLRCGSDIAANGFWRAMGFYCQSVTDGGVRRMRKINEWRKDFEPQLFVTETEASTQPADASTWRKFKGSKQSQFIRGDALRVYREEVLARKQADQQ